MSDHFTADEIDVLRVFERADDAPESLRVRVAEALREVENAAAGPVEYVDLADAAIATIKAAQ